MTSRVYNTATSLTFFLFLQIFSNTLAHSKGKTLLLEDTCFSLLSLISSIIYSSFIIISTNTTTYMIIINIFFYVCCDVVWCDVMILCHSMCLVLLLSHLAYFSKTVCFLIFSRLYHPYLLTGNPVLSLQSKKNGLNFKWLEYASHGRNGTTSQYLKWCYVLLFAANPQQCCHIEFFACCHMKSPT